MNAREVLQLVITGDGKGAITEMDKVGSAARKHLGDTEKSLSQLGSRMTSIGLMTTAAGLASGAALFSVSQGAAQLDTDLARIEGNLGSASAAAIEFTKNANDFGLSDRSAASYVAGIGELAVGLGLGEQAAAGFTTETVKLISQLSTLKGQSPAEGLDAIKSALIGEYDPLQRLVPTISAAAIEHRALGESGKKSAKDLTMAEKATATFNIVLDSARSTIEAAGGALDNNAMRNAKLAASYDDLKTSIGREALPVMQRVVGVAGSSVEAYRKLDDATGGWVSRLATVATVGAVASGGISLVVGQGLRAIDVAKDLGGRLKTTEGDLTRGARAARGFGIALGGIGTAFALHQVAGVLNEASRSSIEFEIAMNRMKDATDLEEIDQQISAAARGKEGTGDEIFDFFDRLFSLGERTPSVRFGDYVEEIDNLQRALAGFKDAGELEVLEKAVKRLRSQMELVDTRGLGAKDKADFDALLADLDRYEEYLNSSAAAAARAERENKKVADSHGKVGDTGEDAAWTLDKMAYSLGSATRGAIEYAEALEQGFDPLLRLMDANDRLAEAKEKLAEIESMNAKDVIDANRSLADARQRVDDATRNLTDAQEALNKALNDDPMFGLKSVTPAEELADARERLAEANRRLALNPNDAFALTMKDIAIADMEAANARVQEEKRNAERRADAIESARRQVASAERGLADAQRGVVDAQARLSEVQSQHGLNSKEYSRAAREVIQANLDIQRADAELAEFIEKHGLAEIGNLIGELDNWIALGGPVGDAARHMKNQLQPLIEQAFLFAGTLGAVNSELETFINARRWLAGPEPDPFGSARNWLAGVPGTAPRITGKKKNGGSPPPTGTTIPGRALGGPMNPGWPYQLAENEPEALIISRPGHVIPNLRQFADGTARRSGGEGDTINFTTEVHLTARDDSLAGAAVIQSLRNVARRSGRGLRVEKALG